MAMLADIEALDPDEFLVKMADALDKHGAYPWASSTMVEALREAQWRQCSGPCEDRSMVQGAHRVLQVGKSCFGGWHRACHAQVPHGVEGRSYRLWSGAAGVHCVVLC